MEVAPELSHAEPDPEIQELIAASAGMNLGVDFLPGALPYDPTHPPEPGLAADVVWLDALVTNVDRTPRNPNLLRWHGQIWLIDHGAALFRQHAAVDLAAEADSPFGMIRDHVLLPFAGPVAEADRRLAEQARAAVDAACALVPPEWVRGDYAGFLHGRLAGPRAWVAGADDARA